MKAFELIFAEDGGILGTKELDIRTLRFLNDEVFQFGEKLDKNSIIILKR